MILCPVVATLTTRRIYFPPLLFLAYFAPWGFSADSRVNCEKHRLRPFMALSAACDNAVWEFLIDSFNARGLINIYRLRKNNNFYKMAFPQRHLCWWYLGWCRYYLANRLFRIIFKIYIQTYLRWNCETFTTNTFVGNFQMIILHTCVYIEMKCSERSYRRRNTSWMRSTRTALFCVTNYQKFFFNLFE